ncbi:MAG: hypothetical protein ACLPV8_21015 [Steroidobacteraceae bacterium]
MAEIAKTELLQTEGTEAVEERKRLMKQLKVGVQNMGKTILRDGESSLDKHIEITGISRHSRDHQSKRLTSDNSPHRVFRQDKYIWGVCQIP